jgi:GGDEF domain-containing protein
MRYLRRSIIALIIHLAVFFNIERLDIGEENLVNIHSFVYVLSLIAVLAVILLPFFRKRPVWVSFASWGVVYGVILLAFFSNWALVGLNLYLSITELVLLLIAVWLAHQVSLDLQDFEQAVINMTLPQVSRQVRRLNDSSDEIQTEMVRSRRHRRPLSVLVIKPDPNSINTAIHRTIQEVQQAMMTRYVVTSLTRVVSDVMRRTDTIFEQPNANQFIVLSPETSATNSSAFVERIKAAASEKLGVDVICGVASFPDNALTFDELVREAEAHATQQQSRSLQTKAQTETRSPVQTEV